MKIVQLQRVFMRRAEYNIDNFLAEDSLTLLFVLDILVSVLTIDSR